MQPAAAWMFASCFPAPPTSPSSASSRAQGIASCSTRAPASSSIAARCCTPRRSWAITSGGAWDRATSTSRACWAITSSTASPATQFLHDMAQSREIVLMARRRLPLPPRLVAAAAVPPSHAVASSQAPAPQYKRTLRERQAVVAVALIQVAGGARRTVAGTAAVAFLLVGLSLILFPLVASAVLAAGALVTSVWLAGWALARRRRRRESDVR